MRVLRVTAQLSRRVRNITVAALFLLTSAATPMFAEMTAHAAEESLTNVSDKTGSRSTDIAITDLQINGTGNDEVSITVRAPEGYFEVANQAATVSGNGSATITIAGPRNDVNTTLATLSYYSDDLGEVTVTAEYGNNIGNVIHNNGEGGNGHAYIVVNDALPWSEAAAAAETYTFAGQTGYLATITSDQENAYVYDALNQQTGWIGANDIASEGAWRWETGPEAGTQFWSGDFEGSSVDGEYNNWADGEPNNGSGTEDCGQFWNNGNWNDLTCTNPRPYVVEFGGTGPLEPIQTTFKITTTRQLISVGSCEELSNIATSANQSDITLTQDIDCNGSIIAPLFDDDPFEGTFDGAGHTISNFVIDEPEGNNTGLIAGTHGATIRDLTIRGADVTGQDRVGALIGRTDGGVTVRNVHVRDSEVLASSTENDDDADDVGGLIGRIYIESNQDHTATVADSSFEGDINITDGASVGGLIGSISTDETTIESAATVERSYANARITAGADQLQNGYSEEIGGLVGTIYALAYGADHFVTLRDVYSWGSINNPTGSQNEIYSAGGLIGAAYTVATESHVAVIHIQRAYANVSVTAVTPAGGLIGFIEHDSYSPPEGTIRIEDSFAAGKVTSDEGAGGLIGFTDRGSAWNGDPYHVALDNTYYDQTRTGQSQCASDAELSNCSAVNTNGSQSSYFINNSTNAPLNTWDFEGVWVANTYVMPTFTRVVHQDDSSTDNAIENGAPNNGDGNNDGIPDADQHNVASLIDSTSGRYVTLVVDESCDLSDVSMSSVASHGVADTRYSYATGFVNFTATGCANGNTDVKLFYHGVESKDLIARKFNPNTGTYFTITTANLSAATSPLNATVVSYNVTDNGNLDINSASGVITDPVGLATDLEAAGAPDTGYQKHSPLVPAIAAIAGLAVLASIILTRQYQLKRKK